MSKEEKLLALSKMTIKDIANAKKSLLNVTKSLLKKALDDNLLTQSQYDAIIRRKTPSFKRR